MSLPEERLRANSWTYYEYALQHVVVNAQNLDAVLKQLKDCIERLITEKYDGTRTCNNSSGRRLYHMFRFSAANQTYWTIKLIMDDGYFHCFHPEKEDDALIIVKDYIEKTFVDKLQNIGIRDKRIYLIWNFKS